MVGRIAIIVSLSYILLLMAKQSGAANILFFFTGGTYSHDISIWPLVIRLADRNHSVTFFSAHTKKPWKDSRINVVTPRTVEEINSKYLGDVLKMRLNGNEQMVWDSFSTWSYEICEYILSNKSFEETSAIFDRKFDLVILDAVLCDCAHIVAYHHKAKVIVSDSTSVLPWFYSIYGFPHESSWVPTINLVFTYPMGIINLITNYFEPVYRTFIRRTDFYPKLDLLMQKFFETDDIPSYAELERSGHLVFTNTHPSVELPQSLPPNFIQIGGMQMWGQRNATIPESIETFMESAQDGVVLIAFGSAVDFSTLPAHMESAFFDAIRRFPKLHFIARASEQRPSHCPRNLQYEKWIPQKEILAHPKSVACITHGGLNGILEATWNAVPLITIPIFAEQDYQSYKLQARTQGIRLEMRDLSADLLATAISDITNNPIYRKNMEKMQAAFRDRPQTPLDLATYWVEFVLRHDDLSFMNPITYQPWKVYYDDCCYSKVVWITAISTVVFATLSIRCLFRRLV